MGRIEVEEYESWDLSPLYIPPRSTLYPLKPIGVGTPWVESLTSYIARLADAHCVFSGRLMDKVIVPLVPRYSPLERQHDLFRGDGDKSNLMNATGLRALYAVQALETLTLRADLRHLTLLFLADMLYVRGLIRHKKAWCPVCYHEWRATGQTIFDPLLWVFQEISVCVRHKQRLQMRCPYQDCQHSLQALAWRSQPGYCTFCQRWLGLLLEVAETAKEPLSESELAWQQWISEALGTVLAVAPTVATIPRREQISQVLAAAIKHVSGGSISAFARTLGLAIPHTGQWVRNEKVPQIGMLLQLCYSLSLSLSEVLFHDPTTLQPHVRDSTLPQQSWKHRLGAPIDRNHIRQELENVQASDQYPPLPLAEVARQLGYQEKVLYQCHQAACHAIAARYKAYRYQQKEVRMQGYREEIRHIALQLRSQSISLTQKHIAPHLAQPGILRDPQVRELLREVCQELEKSAGS
jgi:hypothetical protein